MDKFIKVTDESYSILEKEAFERGTTIPNLVCQLAESVKKEKLDSVSGDLSEINKKLDLLIEKANPKKRTKKSVMKFEKTCSFQQILIDYRKSINKPLKTERGLNQLVNSIDKCALEWGVTRNAVLNYMAGNEWQSISPEYNNPFVKKTSNTGQSSSQGIDDILG